ncbi:MAG TPA: hypothetical protein VHQ41_04160, partial [Patescibacteria group bacterium]|nr:hypothetical protein [Patescibacteria group bacterium]
MKEFGFKLKAVPDRAVKAAKKSTRAWLVRGSMVVAIMALTFTSFGPAFAAQVGSAISLTSPVSGGPCSTSLTVSAAGSATAVAPPGNLDQYAVNINWGDGTIDTVIAKPSFGTAHGTSTLPFTGQHTYATTGSYVISALIYHS